MMSRRRGLFAAIDDAIGRGYYENEEDATNRALEKQKAQDALKATTGTNGTQEKKEAVRA